MRLKPLRAAVLTGALLMAAASGLHAAPFTVLSNNASPDNKQLFVELMYEQPACGDYKAMFFRTSAANPHDSVPVPVDSFMNNPGTYETDAAKMSLARPKAGGYRLRFTLPDVENPADSGYQICVKSYMMAYKCVGCGAAGSDAIFGPQDIDPSCPYPNAQDDLNLLACWKREGQAANWEAWVYDTRDCRPYRTVQAGDGSWWFAQNLRWTEAGKCPPDGDCSQGQLYTWYEAITGVKNAAMYGQYLPTNPNLGPQGVCPPNWHVPTDAEWSALANSTAKIKGLTQAYGAWELDGMRDMRDSIGFSWRPTPVEAAVGAAGTSAKQGMMWTVPATWDNNYAISRATPMSARNTWGTNITTTDNKMGTKFDYLPVRCVQGVGEAVKPDGTAELQELGAINISSNMNMVSGGEQFTLTASISTYPHTATYRWIATPVNDGAEEWILGTSNAPGILVTAPATLSANTTYNVKVVVVAVGYKILESATIPITVQGNCTPIQQGAMGIQQVCPATEVLLNPMVSGGRAGDYQYQWQKKVGVGGTWSDIDGATSATYTVTGLVADNEILFFKRYVTSCSGTVNSISSEGQVSVYGLAQRSVESAVCYGCPGVDNLWKSGYQCNSGLFPRASGGNGVYTYQWQTCATNSSDDADWTTIAAPEGTVENYPINTPTAVTTPYYRRIAYSCNGALRNVGQAMRYNTSGYTLTVTPAATTYRVCPDVNVSMSVSISSAGCNTVYQWQKNISGVWTNIDGATAAAYTVKSNVALNVTDQYRCVATHCNGAGRVANSAVVSVISSGAPAVVTPASPVNTCPSKSLRLAPGNVSSASYQWQVSTDNVAFTDITGATSSDYTFTTSAVVNNTTYYRRMLSNTTCPTAASVAEASIAVITNGNGLTQENVASPVLACAGEMQPVGLTVTGGDNTYAYQWQKSVDDGVTWQNMEEETNASTTFSNGDGVLTTDYYRRVASSCSVHDTSNAFQLKFVAPASMVVRTLPEQYNVSARYSYPVSTSVTNASKPTYEWQESSDLLTWSKVPNSANDTLCWVFAPQNELQYSDKYYRLQINTCGVDVHTTLTRLYTVGTCPPYDGMDMMENSCVKRTTGEQNWEAYIEDSRDGKQYRIVHMPDNRWWFAQNLYFTEGLTLATTPNENGAMGTAGFFWCPAASELTANPTGETSCLTWGAQYNHHSAMREDGLLANPIQWTPIGEKSTVRGVCPYGWVVPGDYDFATMINAVEKCPGGIRTGVAPCNCGLVAMISANPSCGAMSGYRLRNKRQCPANNPYCATITDNSWTYTAAFLANESEYDIYGFSALGTGRIQSTCCWRSLGEHSYTLTSTIGYGSNPTYYFPGGFNSNLSAYRTSWGAAGASVRCVKSDG